MAKMRDIFWELAERIYDNHKHLLSRFRSTLMTGRAAMYETKIRDAG